MHRYVHIIEFYKNSYEPFGETKILKIGPQMVKLDDYKEMLLFYISNYSNCLASNLKKVLI